VTTKVVIGPLKVNYAQKYMLKDGQAADILRNDRHFVNDMVCLRLSIVLDFHDFSQTLMQITELVCLRDLILY
jgi:hypothetical protein